mgnify:CR=1 FL=1
MVTTGHWGRHGKAIGAALIGGAMLIGPGSGAVKAQQAPVVVAPQALPPPFASCIGAPKPPDGRP